MASEHVDNRETGNYLMRLLSYNPKDGKVTRLSDLPYGVFTDATFDATGTRIFGVVSTGAQGTRTRVAIVSAEDGKVIGEVQDHLIGSIIVQAPDGKGLWLIGGKEVTRISDEDGKVLGRVDLPFRLIQYLGTCRD